MISLKDTLMAEETKSEKEVPFVLDPFLVKLTYYTLKSPTQSSAETGPESELTSDSSGGKVLPRVRFSVREGSQAHWDMVLKLVRSVY